MFTHSYILIPFFFLGEFFLTTALNHTEDPNMALSGNIAKPTSARERFLQQNALTDRPRGILVLAVLSLGIAIGLLVLILTLKSLKSKENHVAYSFHRYDRVGYARRKMASRDDWKVMENASDDPPRRLIASTSV